MLKQIKRMDNNCQTPKLVVWQIPIMYPRFNYVCQAVEQNTNSKCLVVLVKIWHIYVLNYRTEWGTDKLIMRETHQIYLTWTTIFSTTLSVHKIQLVTLSLWRFILTRVILFKIFWHHQYIQILPLHR